MSTPLVNLMLERCAQAIEKAIIPKLTDAFALEQAMFTAVLLSYLATAVEPKYHELIEENEEIKKVMEKGLKVLRGEKALAGDATSDSLIDKIDRELKKVETESADFAEENHNLRLALMETIYGLDDLTEKLPAETITPLRQEIRSVLRHQLNHTLVRIEALAAARAESGLVRPGFSVENVE